VLEKGEIAEQGNHQQLVEHNGIYAGLLNESIIEVEASKANTA
jgi:ATP-binding cassette subfamily B protein